MVIIFIGLTMYIWDEANSYIYKPCTFSFVVSLVVILGAKFLNVKLQNTIYYILMFGIIFAPIILTEIHLRRFNKNQMHNYP